MWLNLDERGPIHRQVYRALRGAILSGVLGPGAGVPGSRTLARSLGLSRNTILRALEQLTEEGYAEVRRGAGTYVVRELPIDSSPSSKTKRAAASTPVSARLSCAAAAAARFDMVPSWALPRDPRTIDFRYGDAAYQDLPIATWTRLYARRFRKAGVRDLAYRAPGGEPSLRAEVAAYLSRARGVRCRPEQVIITSGSQQAIDLCLRVLIDPGDRVALEEPHYPGFRVGLMHARARCVGIPVDHEGLRVDRLVRQKQVRLVLVTPSHQYPTGAVLPAARRLALLEWARAQQAYVLEDDYDGEFRYAGRPLESLQGRDEHQRVLYVGTFSKIMFPALRLGYVVAPESLTDPILRMKAAADTGSAGMDQQVLAEFIAAGHLERHIRRTRVRNAARRAALLASIAARLGTRVRASSTPAGLHVWLEVPALAAEHARTLITLARSEGVTLHPGAWCYLGKPPHATFILGYAGLGSKRIDQGIQRLEAAFDRLVPLGYIPR